MAHALEPDMYQCVIGVDVGGSKIAAGVVDRAGVIRARIECPTDVSTATETVDSIVSAIRHVAEMVGCPVEQIAGIGLGIPGKVNAAQGIGVLSVNLHWHDVPVQAMLEERLHVPCRIENDVKAGALGELAYGAAQGITDLVYLVVGTGVAAGIICDGKLYRGSGAMAGEVGHAVLFPQGRMCKCGARGCLEAHVAGPAIAERARAAMCAEHTSSVKHDDSSLVTAKTVLTAAAQGDVVATRVVHAVAADLAFAIQILFTCFDPQMFVLAGGIAHAGAPLLNAVRQELAQYASRSSVFNEIYSPPAVQLSALQNDAGILGAAALVTEIASARGEPRW